MADDVLAAGQILHRDLGQILSVSPAPTGARARADQAGGRLSRRLELARRAGYPRDEALDERLRQIRRRPAVGLPPPSSRPETRAGRRAPRLPLLAPAAEFRVKFA